MCIKAKDGSILIEKKEVLNRWEEYIQELYNDNRGDMPSYDGQVDGPEILEDEVRHAIQEMKKGRHTDQRISLWK